MATFNAQLQSSWLASAEYDDETEELTVSTVLGRDYTHRGVPLSMFEALRDARSAGAFYNANIKGVYS